MSFLRILAGLVPALALVQGPPARAQENPIELEGLVVTGSPTPRPFDAVTTHVTVLEGEELRARGVSRVLDALREVPGVQLVQGGSPGSITSVFLRGGESDYVLVLVDGVQVNQPGGAFDFSSLGTADVERIEVVRGPASALYGSDAVAGVIHVITRTGSGPVRGSVRARAGSFGAREGSVAISGGSQRTGYGLTLARTSGDGILELNNGHRSTVLTGAVRFRPDDGTAGRLSVRLTERVYHFPTDGVGNVVDANAFTFEDQASVGVSLNRRLAERLDLQAFVGVNGTDGGTDDAPDGPADTLGTVGFTSLDHVRRTSADVRANLRIAGGVATLGWELEEERQRSFTETRGDFGTSSDRSGFARRNRGYYAHVSRDGRSLAVEAGARLEDNERYGRLATWQLGGAWRIRGHGRLWASLGRGIKEPTFFENYATGFARGNPGLDPERSSSWEVGLESAFARGRARLGATYFDQRFEDLIQYTFSPPAPSDPNFFNVAEASARGVELVADGRIGGVAAAAGWTWLDTEVIDAGFDEGAGATFVEGSRLLRRPVHTSSVRVAYTARAVSVSAELLRVGSREDRDFTTFPAEPVRLPAYTVLALGGEVHVHADLALTLRGENLTDRTYEEAFGFRAPGRGLYVGARWRFGAWPPLT